jgi:Thermolysin metallopeptidase, alpha-helical domain/Thermolysin metallopeptidase, catalytic domain
VTLPPARCHFIPPYLLERLAFTDADVEIARCGHATLAIDAGLRAAREVQRAVTSGGGWAVHTASNRADLPGTPVRSAGQPPSGDAAVDEAYDGLAATLALLGETFGRASYDGEGAHVVATVHYERNYDNAFWDGRQLVFGDGDGRVFDRFTRSIDVLGHELGHAVVQHTAGLAYSNQPGALNESLADVFGAMVKQRTLGQDARDADWLIGEGLFLPGIQARGLRDMLNPGTAYDDPLLGRDPQGASMTEYVETREDNGGVHLNSGIPNRAFALAATALGGHSWETAGQIWYSALTSGLGSAADFAEFAAATTEVAPTGARGAVAEAWAAVGVGSVGLETAPSKDSTLVAVSRTGGFAGLKAYGELRLGDDPRTGEVEQLLTRIDVDRIRGGAPQPDRFVYSFTLRGREIVVGEPDLTPELARLVTLVLESG